MNLHDLEKIYEVAKDLYKKDPTLTNIQINLNFKDPDFEKKIGVINVDFRNKKIENKTYKKLEKNPFVKPQINEKNGKYNF
jgi:hypothetical protein